MELSLSVIIITKNSANIIEKCLASIKWATEIIVLDSGSTDETISICRKYTDKVFQTDWPGYGIQKNRALKKATCDWVFSIDSDEWIDNALRDEMIQIMQHPTASVFEIKRLNQYCGHWIRHGDVGKDVVTRFFKRGAAQFSDDVVHEHVITNEPIGKQSLFHNSYDSIFALLDRMNKYTTLSAQQRYKRNKKTSFVKALFSSAWAFIRGYFFRGGFLDGKIGFLVSVSSAESSFFRHIKLLELYSKDEKNRHTA